METLNIILKGLFFLLGKMIKPLFYIFLLLMFLSFWAWFFQQMFNAISTPIIHV